MRVARIPFKLPHVDRAVEFDAIAGVHAWRRAGPSADRWERRAPEQDSQRLVGAFVGQRIEKALHVVAGRTDVVARRHHLLPVRLFGCPLARLQRGRGAAAAFEQARAAPDGGRGHALLGHIGLLRQSNERNLFVSPGRRDDVPADEAEMLERGEHLVQRNSQHARHRTGERRVDDGHAAGAEAVVAGNRRGVDGSDPIAGKLLGEARPLLGRVDEYPAAHPEPGDDCRPDQCWVEHDDVVRLVDQVSSRDRLVGIPAERLDRRA